MSDYRDANRDPITDEPGAHPVGTGIGAALGGAAAGAAAGAFGGPVPDGHPNSPAYGHLKLPHLN